MKHFPLPLEPWLWETLEFVAGPLLSLLTRRHLTPHCAVSIPSRTHYVCLVLISSFFFFSSPNEAVPCYVQDGRKRSFDCRRFHDEWAEHGSSGNHWIQPELWTEIMLTKKKLGINRIFTQEQSTVDSHHVNKITATQTDLLISIHTFF